ncbi:MAG TPA: hypothetical protein VFN23_06195 [Ktedonobacteraceae bacterium]|nr:hypothetical protein [Ktedonobacteraceae bacterium]
MINTIGITEIEAAGVQELILSFPNIGKLDSLRMFAHEILHK